MKFFTVMEMCQSEYAKIHGIVNRPNEYQRLNIIALIDNVLDPLREAIKKPIIVNSGFRCDALNMAIGGVSNSQHRLGEAADIICAHMTVKELASIVIEKKIPFDQMINEYNRWLHISYRKHAKNRFQFLEKK